jgi:hypothetical protein
MDRAIRNLLNLFGAGLMKSKICGKMGPLASRTCSIPKQRLFVSLIFFFAQCNFHSTRLQYATLNLSANQLQV